MTATDRVADHYTSSGISERISGRPRGAQGMEAPVTPDALAPLDHFHGRGLAATKELVELLTPQVGERILDIGGGIGRLAGSHGTSAAMSPAWTSRQSSVGQPRKLNAVTGLSDRVRVVEGSATDLPFSENTFDRAYSENVAMNIEEKPLFYAEAFQVLHPGGVFAFSNYGSGPGGEPYYPAPWAASAATSFLSTPDETRADLLSAGFRDPGLPRQDCRSASGPAREPPPLRGAGATPTGAARAHGRANHGSPDQRRPRHRGEPVDDHRGPCPQTSIDHHPESQRLRNENGWSAVGRGFGRISENQSPPLQ